MAKVTRKEVKRISDFIICVPYADLQHLLKFADKFGHCERVEGWACNIYYFRGEYDVSISTGYAPFGNVKPAHDFIKEYDNKAREIQEKYPREISYNEMTERTAELLKEFIDKCIS